MLLHPPPPWAAPYIGRSYADRGACWGLVHAVLDEVFGVEVPDYVGRYGDPAARAEVAALIAVEMAPWRPVEPGAERPGDVLLFRVMGHPCHVGIWYAPGHMLHSEHGADAAADVYAGWKWGRRLVGIYRHEALP